jgi:hypothetical protein
VPRIQRGVSLPSDIWDKLYELHPRRVSMYIQDVIVADLKKKGELTKKESMNLDCDSTIGKCAKDVGEIMFASGASIALKKAKANLEENVKLGLMTRKQSIQQYLIAKQRMKESVQAQCKKRRN